MSDGGIVTAEANGFSVTTNSGISEEQLRQNLKPEIDKGVSKSASELGKLGAKAAAEARKAKAEESDAEKPEAKPVRDGSPEKTEKPQSEPETGSEEKAAGEKESDEVEEKPPEEKKPNPRHDPKARMLEATRKEAEAKRALRAEQEAKAALEARLAALERQAAPKEPERASQRDPDAAPDLKDFISQAETYEEGLAKYLEARDEFRDRQHAIRSQQEAVNHAIRTQAQKFQESAAKHMDRYSDEVLSLQTEFQLPEGTQPTGANWIANELFASPETAPSLMLHLSEHPEELQRIAALPNPRAVSREMAKLEARLEAATAGNSPRRDEEVSRAAPPVRPVTGKPYVIEGDTYREGMNLDEYARIWNKQKRLR